MTKTLTVIAAIVLGGMAVGAKLHELAGLESYIWIIGSIMLQVAASRME